MSHLQYFPTVIKEMDSDSKFSEKYYHLPSRDELNKAGEMIKKVNFEYENRYFSKKRLQYNSRVEQRCSGFTLQHAPGHILNLMIMKLFVRDFPNIFQKKNFTPLIAFYEEEPVGYMLVFIRDGKENALFKLPCRSLYIDQICIKKRISDIKE